MIKVLGVFLAVLYGVVVFSQSKEIDSLRKLYQVNLNQDTAKLNLICKIHNEFFKKTNYDSMELYQAKAIRLASLIGDNESLAKAKMLEAKLLYKKRKFRESLNRFNELEALLETVNNRRLKYYLEAYRGTNYHWLKKGNRLEDFDSTLLAYYSALAYLDAVSVKEQATGYHRIAQVYTSVKAFDSANVYVDYIQQLAEENKDIETELLYYKVKSDIYKKKQEKDSVFLYLKKGKAILHQQRKQLKNYKKLLNNQYARIGTSYYTLKEYDSCIVYLDSCVKLSLEIKEIDVFNRVFHVLSYVLTNKGENEKALDLANSAIKLGHEYGDSSLIAKSKYSMTFVYDAMKDYKSAINIDLDLLQNYLAFFPSHYEQTFNSDLSYFYHEDEDYVNAIKYGLVALRLNPDKSNVYFNLGDAYLAAYKDSSIKKITILPRVIEGEGNVVIDSEDKAKKEVLDLVRKFYEKSIPILEQTQNFKDLVHPYNGLGDYYFTIGDRSSALVNYTKAWEYSSNVERTMLKDKLRVAKRLYILNKEKKNNGAALHWLEITDSLEKEQLAQNNLKELGKKQAEYEFSQKLYADSLKQKEKDLQIKYEKEQQELKLEAEQTKRYYLYGGLLLLVLFLLVLYRRFQLTLKQKKVIELQKEAIDEKRTQLRKTHEGIQDSINYSKRIQKAVFPSSYLLKELFPDSFIFFEPKDVVSGDFYWYVEVDGKRVFVTADCTGHGVPGAFMTIIGINILKEVIQEGITDTAAILKAINVRLIERLSQRNQSSVKDGMDLAICVIDEKTIEFAGAHLPLYHVRNGELVEYKGSNLFLGAKLDQPEPKVHYIPYEKGDVIYMSTDGLPDQKGGEKGKKFYAKRLRAFLLEHSECLMTEQHVKLKELRETWIGDQFEQLDDMTVVGIKL
ncbi:MAG: SpoIIE family protein phosphatase [Flavobacteriales bacterium]|jgi:serine phosphatase RsbU (regulator of sigma subunit)|nr:SpoIIE family protein phosphatase [Flavobacteriales bacterium]